MTGKAGVEMRLEPPCACVFAEPGGPDEGHSRRHRAIPSLLCTAWLLALAGCGNTAQQQLVPVKGKVVYEDGSPVPDVVIRFYPQEETNKKGAVPYGVVDKAGKFSLTCLRGRYKVVFGPIAASAGTPPLPITRPGPATVISNPGPGPTSKEQYYPFHIAGRYKAPNSTRLEVTVPEEGIDNVLLRVEAETAQP
jgi:hypothetical protein